MDHVAVWIAGFLTLGILSFLYKDNPWYKLTEAVYVGISAGYWAVSLFWENFYGKFWIQRSDDAWLWVGAVLGFMMLLRLIPRIGWLSRWPLAFLVGATGGLWLINYFASFVMAQVEATLIPLFGADFAASAHQIVGSLVIFIGTFTGVVYFFFSKEHKGVLGGAARIGVFVLMVTFGASFGYTVMSRMSLLIGRIDFILGDWLGVIG